MEKKFTTEFYVPLQITRSLHLFLLLFLPSFPLKDGVRASRNYNVVFEFLT